MHLQMKHRDTLDPAVQQHFRMVEFQLEDVFLVIFILNMDRKSKLVEIFILGPSMARQRVARSVKNLDNA